VDGEMNATTIVLPYNETAVYQPRLRVGMVISKFDYALEVLTTVPALRLRIQADVRRIRKVEVPAASISVAALVPKVSSGGSVKPPLASIALAAVAPAVASGSSVAVPLSTIAVAGINPEQAGKFKTQVFVPSADLALAAAAPAVQSGASVAVPAKDVAVAALVPKTGYIDTDFSSVSLLLHMDGSNGSTTFTDSSSNALTVTANGNAQISTAESKFGGASAVLDGTGDYLSAASDSRFDLGNTYTIEFWVRPATTPSYNFGLVHRGFYTTTTNNWDGLAFSIRCLNGTGSLRFYFYGTTNANEQVINVTGALALNTWTHVAMVRNGSTGYAFINGVQSGTISGLNTPGSSTKTLQIGRWDFSAGAEDFNGYIDDLRITKGVARYTSNFTVPPQAFANQ
jgi:hypothetical protein